jgi:hypothetical protein
LAKHLHIEVVDRFRRDPLTTQKWQLLRVKNPVKDMANNVVRDLIVAMVIVVAIEAACGLLETLAELILTPSLEL